MGETVKFRPFTEPDSVPSRPKGGVKAGCVLCGEIRAIYEDGTLEVIHAGSTK